MSGVVCRKLHNRKMRSRPFTHACPISAPPQARPVKKHRKRTQAPRKEVPRMMDLATGVSLLVEARGLSTARPTALRMNAVGPSICQQPDLQSSHGSEENRSEHGPQRHVFVIGASG